ncbi:MAG: DUF559 domain-containing protein [Actinophytocola sp.]|nr:DUF559 domain-containing protein [Actinophytocola sp.]
MISLPDGPHGAYRRSELVRLLGSDVVRDALDDGTLRPFGRSVLIDARRAITLHTRAAATLLLAGSDVVLTGFTALAVWGCSAAPAGPIHVLMPYHRRMKRRAGVVVHNGSFQGHDIHDVAGLPTMALDFALAEALCRGNRRDGLACADQAFALAAECERAEFRAAVAERIRTRPDPRGRRRARRLLGLATGLAESPPESWTLLLFDDAGLPRPTPQYPIHDLSGREIYRLDFAWPELRVAVEYDGYEAHENRADRDELRDRDLRRRGWIVIRANSTDLSDPSRLLDRIAAAFGARGMAA